ncbi:MAG: hypothetical protein K0S32_3174, partial [Bacteroidetes bacterium]|nr:hypothetical protein [Bacteroidota bacterium]
MRILFILLCSISLNSFAQPLFRNTTKKALTFKEIQLQFHDFKKNNDLKTKKHWKHFKRYEMEMQRMTNAKGEPDGFS